MTLFDEINEIVGNCEEVQKSNESAYTKEQAKLSAYDQIAEILGFGGAE